MRMSLEEVAAILGTSCGNRGQIAQGYSIDSRTIERGDLFFAIRGPRFDGHEFVTKALVRGAVGAVVGRDFFGSAPGTITSSLCESM